MGHCLTSEVNTTEHSVTFSAQGPEVNFCALSSGTDSKGSKSQHNVAWSSTFIKPTDFKDITTDEAVELGSNTWSLKRCILTSIRPDLARGKVRVEAIDANMYRKYGFIAPDTDYGIVGAGVANRPVDVAASVQDATGAALKAIIIGRRS